MANICSSTPIRDTSIKGLTAELNFLRSTICTLQSQVINGGGGGGPTIYTGDGSLTGDRTVDLNGHNLTFDNGAVAVNIDAATSSTIFTGEVRFNGNIFSAIDNLWNVNGHILKIYDPVNSDINHPMLLLNPSSFNSFLQSFNPTNDGNYATLDTKTTPADATFKTGVSFNDGVKEAYIEGFANAGSATLEYEADTHTFNVGMTITELAGVGTRAIAVDATGKIVLL